MSDNIPENGSDLLLAWELTAITKPSPQGSALCQEDAELDREEELQQQVNQKITLLDQLRHKVQGELTKQCRYLASLGGLPSLRRTKNKVRQNIAALKAEDCALVSQSAEIAHTLTDMD